MFSCRTGSPGHRPSSEKNLYWTLSNPSHQSIMTHDMMLSPPFVWYITLMRFCMRYHCPRKWYWWKLWSWWTPVVYGFIHRMCRASLILGRKYMSQFYTFCLGDVILPMIGRLVELGVVVIVSLFVDVFILYFCAGRVDMYFNHLWTCHGRFGGCIDSLTWEQPWHSCCVLGIIRFIIIISIIIIIIW